MNDTATPINPVTTREELGELLALVGDYDGAHQRVRDWDALPQDEKDAYPGEEPHTDREDAEFWNLRADAALAWFAAKQPTPESVAEARDAVESMAQFVSEHSPEGERASVQAAAEKITDVLGRQAKPVDPSEGPFVLVRVPVTVESEAADWEHGGPASYWAEYGTPTLVTHNLDAHPKDARLLAYAIDDGMAMENFEMPAAIRANVDRIRAELDAADPDPADFFKLLGLQ